MGFIDIAQETTPTAPSAGTARIFSDSADSGRVKVKLPDNQLYILNMSGFDKNVIINGGMDFFQRQNPTAATSVGGSTTARTQGPDRWGCTASAANCTVQRVDTNASPETGLAARFYLRAIKTTGAGKVCFSQVVESHPTMPLRGRTVRLQLKMKRAVAAAMTVRVGLVQNNSSATADTIAATFISSFAGTDPTLGTNLAYIVPEANTNIGGTISGNALECTLGTGWVMYAAVFIVPSNCKNIIPVIFSAANMATTDELHISEVGLYDGPDVIDWIPMPFAVEQERIRRFYEKSFLVDTAPAQNVGVNSGEVRGVAGKAGAVANAGFIPIPFRTEKRASPTVTVFNPAAANALARNITGAADMGATTITGTTAQNTYTNSTGVAATAVGDLIAIHFTADAEI